MSGNQPQQQQSGTPGVFATLAGASTPRRISDWFTPATGFRGPPIYQQSRGRGSGSRGTPATRVGFANPIVGGSNAPAGGGTTNVGQQGHGSGVLGRQASKFVRATDVYDADMLDVDVALKKENYGELGSSDYWKNMAMATAALYEKFGVARHKIVTSEEEGDQTKHQYGNSANQYTQESKPKGDDASNQVFKCHGSLHMRGGAAVAKFTLTRENTHQGCRRCASVKNYTPTTALV